MENRNLKVGVIGLGLIGGSILKALNKINTPQTFELIGISKSSHRKAARILHTFKPKYKRC